MQLTSVNLVDLARTLSSLSIESTKSTSLKLSGKTDGDQNKLEAVAQEFESLFMHMMLKAMRTANRTFSEGNYFDTFETRMYEDMLDEELSIHMTKSHSMGIADLMVKQLRPAVRKQDYDMEIGSSTVPTRQTLFQTPDDFVAEILPRVKSTSAGLGLDPRFVVAQAALETGWGQHIMFDASGNNSFNLFGIKASADWQGKTVEFKSLEVVSGVAARVKSKFKVYGSYDEAIADYAHLLKHNDRYAAALNAADIRSFGEQLRKGGYATDPDYAGKLARVMDNGAFGGSQTAMFKQP